MGRQGEDPDQSLTGGTPDITAIKSRAEKILSERGEVPTLDKKFIDAVEEVARNATEEAKIARERESIRNVIGKLIMLAFLPSVFLVIAVIVLLRWLFPNDEQPVNQIIGMFKDTVLPVVTLVLGYFFGGAQSRG